jgi:hypothetical protein
MLSEMDVRAALLAVSGELRRAGVAHALIGGLALAPHGAGRGTQDLDLLADGDRADEVDRILAGLGYERIHRTADVGNYLSSDPAKGRVDFLFARRPLSRGMLERARSFPVLNGVEVRVVDAEDLIGFKVQSSSNNPRRRLRDMADVLALLERAPNLDLARIRNYFRLFDREKELDELLAQARRP